jgi:hypothetical protein
MEKMITFWNDHLVSPVFCKLIYDTVPIEFHVPVVFFPHTKDFGVAGRCYYDRIDTNLQEIFYFFHYKKFELWKELLNTTYHEFGHIATDPFHSYLSNDAYETNLQTYYFVEGLANEWADHALLRLAENDKRLYQPYTLGPYFDGRIIKFKNAYHKAFGYPNRSWTINERRKYISGGQLSANEVARGTNAYIYSNGNYLHPDTRLINKLAVDLAYPYIDHRGYKHQFFAWGDLPEIIRRVTIFKATHRIRPTEAQYMEHIKSGVCTLPDASYF